MGLARKQADPAEPAAPAMTCPECGVTVHTKRCPQCGDVVRWPEGQGPGEGG